jgi:hypothetical protein
MSYPNNDPFIAGAYGSDTTDDFLRITDDAIDQAHPAAERVWQGQSEKNIIIPYRPSPPFSSEDTKTISEQLYCINFHSVYYSVSTSSGFVSVSASDEY